MTRSRTSGLSGRRTLHALARSARRGAPLPGRGAASATLERDEGLLELRRVLRQVARREEDRERRPAASLPSSEPARRRAARATSRRARRRSSRRRRRPRRPPRSKKKPMRPITPAPAAFLLTASRLLLRTSKNSVDAAAVRCSSERLSWDWSSPPAISCARRRRGGRRSRWRRTARRTTAPTAANPTGGERAHQRTRP